MAAQMLKSRLYLLVCILCHVYVQSSRQKASACQKQLPLSFTAQQRSHFCAGVVHESGAVHCANDAKSSLKMKYDEIYELCQHSSSAAPVECYKSLSLKDRKNHGILLCGNATSSLPSACWSELTSLKGTNKLSADLILPFCKSIQDSGPLHCLHHSTSLSLLSSSLALDACLYATLPDEGDDKNYPEQCMIDMKKSIQPSRGITASDVVQFCYAVTSSSTSPQDCFHALSESPAAAKVSQSTRLALCWDSESPTGPGECLEAVEKARKEAATGVMGLTDEGVVELCSHALSDGPARCFIASRHVSFPKASSGGKQMDDMSNRLQLCHGAPNDGPARCMRRALGAFRGGGQVIGGGQSSMSPDDITYYSTALCVGAESEGPADCALKAPAWLSPDERVHLCGGIIHANRAQEPLKCLETISNSVIAKRLSNSPKKCMGYFLGNIVSESEKYSRYLLLHMCSFLGSDYPLAAAECFRTAPTILDHDTAVTGVCTNHTYSPDSPEENDEKSGSGGLKYDPQALSSCVKLLPADWNGEDRAVLCARVNSTQKAESVVKCAIDLHKTTRLLSKPDAAAVCAAAVDESPDGEALPTRVGGPGTGRRILGGVAACVRRAMSDVTSSSARLPPDIDLITEVCSKAHIGEAGTCVASFSTKSKQNVLTRDGLREFCSHKGSLSKMGCIKHYQKGKSGPLSLEEVQTCLHTDPVVNDLRVVKFLAADNGIEAVAGKWFSMEIQMIDQWGQNMDGVNGVRIVASINENNDQGAVLWGLRSNSSVDGRVTLSHLVVSQAGPVELKLSSTSSGDMTASKSIQRGRTLMISKMYVYPNPVMKKSDRCLFVFTELNCPVTTSPVDTTQWETTFPNEIGILPARVYGDLLMCLDVLDMWAVSAEVLPSGEGHIKYRYGVDAVWTGRGLPREEMSYFERLDLEEGNLNLKDIRRAYHKKSLQWHPDRWAGLTNNATSISGEVYALAVQGAFELIAEAYKGLNDAAAVIVEEKKNSVPKD
eukprot:CAMPEP_0185040098 /NCGR_PEP_ID=MMETSP1103-20130426/37748_1 /TAXON_ID=36769 /ORGANISM="Paraphysomonas bandaiensis, Strain Caron Lab Isolate" /LENGTH=1002 /DNA_ID=CAMNT_0027579259 /DNA_START=104 /DNA_END=3109 /DNA_ORIENTATION=+